MIITIEQPHGYLRDSDGRVVLCFANWETEETQVPDAVESVEYVNKPTAHTETVADEYQPEPF